MFIFLNFILCVLGSYVIFWFDLGLIIENCIVEKISWYIQGYEVELKISPVYCENRLIVCYEIGTILNPTDASRNFISMNFYQLPRMEL